MSINTQTLDHIVHLTPPGSVEEVSKQFRALGFKVLPGGTHTDKLTQNALVVFADGVYLELISFVHPASYYPAGTPARKARDTHQWAHIPPGWIDFAFLGNGSRALSQSISRLINDRGKKEGSGVRYDAEVEQGRTRTDGKVLRWLISQISGNEKKRGVLPFFCGDVPPENRKLRAPADPPSNTVHPSTAIGIAYVRVLVNPMAFNSVSAQLTSVVGTKPVSFSSSTNSLKAVWELDTVNLNAKKKRSQLVLSTAISEEEWAFVELEGHGHGTVEASGSPSIYGRGIYEVAFFVKDEKVPESRSTPYGKISWVKSE